MQDCVNVGAKCAIIISAGFKETGAEGAILENEIMDIARDGSIRVVGPNCLGVMVRTKQMFPSAVLFIVILLLLCMSHD